MSNEPTEMSASPETRTKAAQELADRLSERIRLAEFSVNQVLVKDLRPVPAVCVIGRP